MLPLIVGHRANTLTKLRFYLHSGVDAVEVDIAGHQVKHGSGSIKPATLREALLRRILFPEPKGDALENIVREVLERNVTLIVDLKTPRVDPHIFRSLPSGENVLISSKYHNLLRTLKPELEDEGISTLASIQDRPVDPVRVMRDALADGLSVELSYVDEDLIRDLRQAGGKIYVWTVNDADQALSLASMGVDAITTDRPDLIISALKNGGIKDNTGRRLYRKLTED